MARICGCLPLPVVPSFKKKNPLFLELIKTLMDVQNTCHKKLHISVNKASGPVFILYM
jgi:hypothetical protein